MIRKLTYEEQVKLQAAAKKYAAENKEGISLMHSRNRAHGGAVTASPPSSDPVDLVSGMSGWKWRS